MINTDLFYFINNNLQNPLFDYIMPTITHLGGFISLLGLCILAVILSTILKKKNIRNVALLCLLSLLIAGGIAVIFKNLFLEPRPFVSLNNVHLLITENDPNSFPSGHTTSTFAVISILIFKYKNKLLRIFLIICGILVGFSRIYVGVHYPFDILVGCLIGVITAYIIFKNESNIHKLYHSFKDEKH